MFPAEFDRKYEPLWRMAAGATAGIFATLLTHPLDVARARLTVQVSDKGSAGRAGKASPVRLCVHDRTCVTMLLVALVL